MVQPRLLVSREKSDEPWRGARGINHAADTAAVLCRTALSPCIVAGAPLPSPLKGGLLHLASLPYITFTTKSAASMPTLLVPMCASTEAQTLFA